jgi:3-phosphoglycerate kinase
MSHLGRPKEGQFDAEASLAPVADRVEGMLRTCTGMDRETLLAPVRLMAEIDALLGGDD